MSDNGLITTYTKAIDDLSGKVFIPASIASLFVEFGPWLAKNQEIGSIGVYLICAMTGFIGASLLLVFLGYLSCKLTDVNVPAVVGTAIMPVGFAVTVPKYFTAISVNLTPVTGVAILAWSFVLIGIEPFKRR